MSNIYEYIAQMKARPGMFTKDKALDTLEVMLHGYVACLKANGLREEYDGRPFEPSAFSIWLYEELGWSGSLGFAWAIEQHTEGRDAAFDRFFELVGRYRHSSPDG
ncbi:hypothetical protein [Labrenzia sp. VG12]|uniref:hypothetical protein n=1 Tax=Labrenzia sp. VG12 TaxID=2021862 RepID=UPI000B8BB9BC|nr:hypothetical protein [Labrenzia sp. VG12]ASP33468.1 hypothetical protein CHH27_09590 [Labrenzia sp. VG12]